MGSPEHHAHDGQLQLYDAAGEMPEREKYCSCAHDGVCPLIDSAAGILSF